MCEDAPGPVSHGSVLSRYVDKRNDKEARDWAGRILFEHAGLVVIDKPWGIPTTGRKLDDSDCVQFGLMELFGEMVWAVHQLDADTTGVNLFVREKELVAEWKQRMLFPNGKKSYLAIVHGIAEFESQRIDEPIGVVASEPSRQLGICADGKRAVSEVHVLERGRGNTLVEVQIETGRTHQIRIHLASLGHPVMGDDWYGNVHPPAFVRQALHAWKLDFKDGDQPAGFESPMPADMRDLWSSL